MNIITQFPAVCDCVHDLPFRAIFEGATIGIGICKLDGQMVGVNPALVRMLGYSQEELMGNRAEDVFSESPREACEQLPAESGPKSCREAGREICAGKFSHEERWLGELLRNERGGLETEKRYRRKDGAELWAHLTVSVGRDTRRQPSFLIYMLAEATGPMRREEQRREAEKMEIIGRLTAGIAHDFNNLLTGILLYCDLLSAGLESGDFEGGGSASDAVQNNESENGGRRENRGWKNNSSTRNEMCRHVEEVRIASEQGAALTHQLLAMARKQPAQARPIPVNEIVVSTENLLRRLIGEQIELVTVLDSGAGLVLADPAQLRQILLNLVLNARDAMPAGGQGGKIRLITRAVDLPAAEGSKSPESGSSRRAVSVAVKDNGCGMDADTRARLFEPFFTKKKPGEGTGLGMATVQRIVNEAGGRIEVETEPGCGTCIEVLLPAIESAIEGSSVAAGSTMPAAHKACGRSSD